MTMRTITQRLAEIDALIEQARRELTANALAPPAIAYRMQDRLDDLRAERARVENSR